MKKSLSVLLAVTLICAFLITTSVFAAGATKNLAEVGVIGDSLWRAFEADETNQITKLIRDEFNRTSQLRSEMHKGQRYFDYGEPDGFVEVWESTPLDSDPDSTDTIGCMVQHFTGGYSTKLLCFDSHAPQWCAIVVTRESFDKGEAYTIRDTIASMYAQAGEINSDWGLPTSNQYWVIEDGQEVLYQRFENGYAKSIDGSYMSLKCHFYHISDEDYDPDFPKTGEADRPSFGDVDIQIDPSATVDPLVDPFNTHDDCIPIEPSSSQTASLIEPTAPSDTSDVIGPDWYDSNPIRPTPVETPESTESASPSASAESTLTAEASTDDTFAEGATTTGTTSMSVRIVRKNTPFLNFLLNYGIFLGAAGLIVIAVIVTVIVLSVRKKKAG